MNKNIRIILITFISFGVYYFLDELYFRELRKWLNEIINQSGAAHIITYLISGIPIYLGVILIHSTREFFSGLGLNKSFAKGICFPLIFTLPMFIGYAVVFNFNTEITLNDVLIKVIAAGFFEELFFRGFLFGQVYRYTKFGFIPSVLLGSLLFGFVHLYQSQDLLTLIGIFITTFLGAILFAWLYAEWNFNLWVAIFLHLFMNLSWLMYSVSDDALGNIYANIFRALTIILAISITVQYKRKNNIKLEVNRQTIWIKKLT